MPDRFPLPGMGAYIDADRAVIGTNSTLYTARGVRYYLSRSQDYVFIYISLENI